MNLDSLKTLLEDFDIANFLPELNTVMGWVVAVLRLAVLAGPVLLLGLGLVYLLIPPKEANHSFGFRCYHGMGSVEAWRFTQRLAGIVLGLLGLVLTIVMVLQTNQYSEMAVDTLVYGAVKCILWEIGLSVAAYFGISVTAIVMFDRFGNRRWEKKERPRRTPGGDRKPPENKE